MHLDSFQLSITTYVFLGRSRVLILLDLLIGSVLTVVKLLARANVVFCLFNNGTGTHKDPYAFFFFWVKARIVIGVATAGNGRCSNRGCHRKNNPNREDLFRQRKSSIWSWWLRSSLLLGRMKCYLRRLLMMSQWSWRWHVQGWWLLCERKIKRGHVTWRRVRWRHFRCWNFRWWHR